MMVRHSMTSGCLRRVVPGILLTVVVAGSCSAQDKPPLKELLMDKHPLLKEVFAKAPDDDVKGLAAKIKAEEMTVRHRIKAVRYLATVDCIAYPEAKEMLVKMLHKDKWEPVRFEAAKALRIMLSTGCRAEEEDEKGFDRWLGAWKKNFKRASPAKAKRRQDYCPGCCDKDTLNALVKTAYEMNDAGNCFESSLRVREMAVEAIKSCGIKCDCGPYTAGEEHGPPPIEKNSGGEVIPPSDPGEVRPPAPGEIRPPDGALNPPKLQVRPAAASRMRAEILATTNTLPVTSAPTENPLPSLGGLCIVQLAQGKKAKTDARYQLVHKGRMYRFSSEQAMAAFRKTPSRYEVAYGGFDPVQFVESRQMADGGLLCRYNGRFYCFSTQANWRTFQARPELYVVQAGDQVTARPVSKQSR